MLNILSRGRLVQGRPVCEVFSVVLFLIMIENITFVTKTHLMECFGKGIARCARMRALNNIEILA